MNDFMSTIARESQRFVDAIEQTDPESRVATVSEWSADDLLWHLTEVHDFWAKVLASGVVEDDGIEAIENDKPDRPANRDEVITLFKERTAALLEELQSKEDDEPAWFWLGTAKTVGSTRRMQAHEAVMHRIDAELTAGIESESIHPEVAFDGIRHGVEVMWSWWGTLPGFTLAPSRGLVELVATDLGRSVLVQPGRWQGTGESGKTYDQPGAVLVESGDAIAEFSGTAEELDRWLWGRGPEPKASGDDTVLTAMREAQAQGMQ